MIYLYTGLNGTGKTSNVLWMFLKDKQYEGRPKYATFIRGFDYEKHGVTFLDADGLQKWPEFPTGSLILVDEAQDFFPIARGQPPEWIARLAKNRHDGYDFLLTTPNGSMINHYVRALVNRHTHFIMKHGALVSALKWDKAQKDPDSAGSKATGEPQSFNTPDEVFKEYTSTQLDTRQVKLPIRTLATIGFCAVLIIAALFYVFSLSGLGKHKQDPESVPGHSAPVAQIAAARPAPGQQSGMAFPGTSPQRDASWYLPRNPLDPSSAPMYDHLTQATDFPRIAACIDSKSGSCNCYSQQGTPIFVGYLLCKRMIKEGWFDNWKSGRAQSERVLSGRSDEYQARDQLIAQASAPDQSQGIVIGDAPSQRISEKYESIYAKR